MKNMQDVVFAYATAMNEYLEVQLARVPEGFMLCVHQSAANIDYDNFDSLGAITLKMTSTVHSHVIESVAECQVRITKTIYQRSVMR